MSEDKTVRLSFQETNSPGLGTMVVLEHNGNTHKLACRHHDLAMDFVRWACESLGMRVESAS